MRSDFEDHAKITHKNTISRQAIRIQIAISLEIAMLFPAGFVGILKFPG
jgi:hypothetical protein